MMKKTINATSKAKVINGKKSKKEEVVEAATPVTPAPVIPPEELKVDPATFKFPVGTKYALGGKLNIVRKAYFGDNTEMRLVFVDNTEEIITLTTLRNEAKSDPEFMILK